MVKLQLYLIFNTLVFHKSHLFQPTKKPFDANIENIFLGRTFYYFRCISFPNTIYHDSRTDPSSNNCDLVCTGGLLSFMTTSSPLTTSSVFTYKGQSLGGSQPGWISQNSRWAPENFVVKNHTVQDEGNIIFVCDSQLDGKHRIGYVWSTTGAKVGAWTDYSANYMQVLGWVQRKMRI